MNDRYTRVFPISFPISDMKKSHPIRSRYPIFRNLAICWWRNRKIDWFENKKEKEKRLSGVLVHMLFSIREDEDVGFQSEMKLGHQLLNWPVSRGCGMLELLPLLCVFSLLLWEMHCKASMHIAFSFYFNKSLAVNFKLRSCCSMHEKGCCESVSSKLWINTLRLFLVLNDSG